MIPKQLMFLALLGRRSAGQRKACDRSGDQVRRLLAVALILNGGTRSEAVKLAGVTLQIVRDWVLRFNVEGPGGLVNRKASGRASILDRQRVRVAAQLEAGPIPRPQGGVRWRLISLAQWVCNPQQAPAGHADRAVVGGRGSDRAEDQAHPPLG